MTLSIVTLNANGLSDQSKRAGLLQWFRSFTAVPDIVCLQEFHCSSDLDFWSSVCPSCQVNSCPWLYNLFRSNLSLIQSRSNFVFVTKSFVSAVSTLLVIQHVISSLTMSLSALVRLSLLCLLVSSTLF